MDATDGRVNRFPPTASADSEGAIRKYPAARLSFAESRAALFPHAPWWPRAAAATAPESGRVAAGRDALGRSDYWPNSTLALPSQEETSPGATPHSTTATVLSTRASSVVHCRSGSAAADSSAGRMYMCTTTRR